MDIRAFLDFMNIAEKMKCTTRHSYTTSGRPESVAEHSWRLGIMAYLMKDEFPDVDLGKIILMCLFHDLGEAVTGDIPAFCKTRQDEITETDVVTNLLSKLPMPYRQELFDLFSEMNALETMEAKLYKSLDRMEAVIQHNEADISTWLPLEYDLQLTYGNKECSFHPYIQKLRDTIREDSLRKIAADNANKP